jgi:hypothetical protein
MRRRADEMETCNNHKKIQSTFVDIPKRFLVRNGPNWRGAAIQPIRRRGWQQFQRRKPAISFAESNISFFGSSAFAYPSASDLATSRPPPRHDPPGPFVARRAIDCKFGFPRRCRCRFHLGFPPRCLFFRPPTALGSAHAPHPPRLLRPTIRSSTRVFARSRSAPVTRFDQASVAFPTLISRACLRRLANLTAAGRCFLPLQ